MEAALEACRIRLRPILMTSFAFIMGVLPLVFSSGAGAEMRHAMGMAVFSGMLGVTFFGLVLTPVFYVVIQQHGRAPAGAARQFRRAAGHGEERYMRKRHLVARRSSLACGCAGAPRLPAVRGRGAGRVPGDGVDSTRSPRAIRSPRRRDSAPDRAGRRRQRR